MGKRLESAHKTIKTRKWTFFSKCLYVIVVLFFFLRGKGIGSMKPFQINVFNRQVSWNNAMSLSFPKLPNAISNNWQAPANVKLRVLSCEYQTTHSIGKHPVMIPRTEGSSCSFFYAWKNNVSLLFRIENFHIHQNFSCKTLCFRSRRKMR